MADTSRSGTASITQNTTIYIGEGAPGPALQNAFLIADQRGAFSTATSLPPLGNVKALGSTGGINGPGREITAQVTALTAAPHRAPYQIAVGASQPFHAFVTDLASAGSTFDVSGSVPATYRSPLNRVLMPQSLNFTAAAVVSPRPLPAGSQLAEPFPSSAVV